MYRYIFFDLDGTIIDSAPGVIKSVWHALLHYGYTEETEEGTITLSYMHYIADISGQYYLMSETQEWPTFPITITPASKTTKSADMKPASVQTFTNAPATFKNYYRSYCEAVK